MPKKLSGASFSARETIIVSSSDAGKTWSSISCRPHPLPPGIVDRVRQAAGLEPTHAVTVLGSSNKSFEFRPPLEIDAAAIAAVILAQELGVPEVEYMLLPRPSIVTPSLAFVRVPPLPEQG